MPDITRTVTPDGELLTIEADSVEEAMASCPEATSEDVVSVERVARGGVGGFFAREAFVVTLRPPQPAVHDVDADDEDDWLGGDEVPERYVVDTRPTGLDAVIAQLAAEEDSKEVSFGALLQQHRQAPLPAATSPAVAPETPTPAAHGAVPGPAPLRHPVEAHKPVVRAWTPPRLEDRTHADAPPLPPTPVVAAPARSLGEVLAASSAVADETVAPVTTHVAPVTALTIPPPPGSAARPSREVAILPPPPPPVLSAPADAPEWSGPEPSEPERSEPELRTPVIEVEPTRPVLRATVSASFRADLRAAVPPVTRATAPTAPAAPTPRPVSVATPAVPRNAPAQRSGDAAWSIDGLLDMGIPEALLVDLPPADPRDEYAWMRALADALSPLCRPLPSGPTLYAGPLAEELAVSLGGVTVVGEAPFVRPDVDAAVTVRGDEAARSWLAHARGDRWLQLVVGGGDTRAVRGAEPLAVSWVGDASLPEALGLACRQGLVLGYGLDASRGGRAHRAHPIDLSVAIRRMMPREGDR